MGDEPRPLGNEAVTTPFSDLFLSVRSRHSGEALPPPGGLRTTQPCPGFHRGGKIRAEFSAAGLNQNQRGNADKNRVLPPSAPRRTQKRTESRPDFGHLAGRFQDRASSSYDGSSSEEPSGPQSRRGKQALPL